MATVIVISLLSGADGSPALDRIAGGTPFRKPFDEAAGVPAFGAKDLDGMISIDAVGSSAIGDVPLLLRQLTEAVLKFVNGTEIAPTMYLHVLFPSRIENHHILRTPPGQ